jgi:hypothetical protein
VASVHTRQATSSAPKQPNRPRPAFVRKRGGSIRQSFVGDAMHMTAAEASNLARQVLAPCSLLLRKSQFVSICSLLIRNLLATGAKGAR